MFELEEASYIHKDVLGNGRTVQLVTWLRPRQQASWQVEVRLSRRGRYLLEPLYLGSGDFLGMTEMTQRATGMQELIVPPRRLPCRLWMQLWAAS